MKQRVIPVMIIMAILLSGCGQEQTERESTEVIETMDSEKSYNTQENVAVEVDNEDYVPMSDVVITEAILELGAYQGDTIRLRMTEGHYYTEEYAGASGGTYDKNYNGQYVLELLGSDGTMISELSINDDWSYPNINFPGNFALCVNDYNEDGNPDFVIGTWGSSSMNEFFMYTVWEDGSIQQIADYMDMCKDFSYQIEQEKHSSDIIAHLWNNTDGADIIDVIYIWSTEEKRYIEKY